MMAIVDTTFVIDLMHAAKRRHSLAAVPKLDELVQRNEGLWVAVFTIAELHVGIVKSNRPGQELTKVERALEPFQVLPFEESTAHIFGSIVGGLEKQGMRISEMDALIASVAIEYGERLITRNLRHFQRIPGLVVESY